MAAVQSFISGAISKTVNMPSTATIDEIKEAYRMGHDWGCKAIALYRDGSKLSSRSRLPRRENRLFIHPTSKSRSLARTRSPTASAWAGIASPGSTWPLSSDSAANFTFAPRDTTTARPPKSGRPFPDRPGLSRTCWAPCARRLTWRCKRACRWNGFVRAGFPPTSSPPAWWAATQHQVGDQHSQPDGAPAAIPRVGRDFQSQHSARHQPDTSSVRGAIETIAQSPHDVANVQITGEKCPECGKALVQSGAGCKKCPSCGYAGGCG